MGALVHASSVGVYSPGPEGPRRWTSPGRARACRARSTSRHKAAAERLLDGLEARYPSLRVVRLRPGLIFKRESGPEIRRLFAGPLLPARLLRPGLLPILPLADGLVVQCVHGADVAEAYRLAALVAGCARRVQRRRRPVLDAGDAGARAALPRRVTVPARRGARAGRPDLPRCGCIPPRPAGSTWAWPCRRCRPSGRAPSWAGRRATRPSRRCSSCWRACATPVGAPTPPLDAQAGGRFRLARGALGRRVTDMTQASDTSAGWGRAEGQ